LRQNQFKELSLENNKISGGAGETSREWRN